MTNVQQLPLSIPVDAAEEKLKKNVERKRETRGRHMEEDQGETIPSLAHQNPLGKEMVFGFNGLESFCFF